MSLTNAQQVEADDFRKMLKSNRRPGKKAEACLRHLTRFKHTELDVRDQLKRDSQAMGSSFKATLKDLADACRKEATLAFEKAIGYAPDRKEEAQDIFDLTLEQRERQNQPSHPSEPLPVERMPYYDEGCEEELVYPDASAGVSHFLCFPHYADYISSIASATEEETDLVVGSFLVHSNTLAKNPEYRIEDIAYLAWAARRFVDATADCIYHQKVAACLRQFSENVTGRCSDQRTESSKRAMRIIRHGFDKPDDEPDSPKTSPESAGGMHDSKHKETGFVVGRDAAAKYAGVDRKTITNWTKSLDGCDNPFLPVEKNGNKVRYKKTDLDKCLKPA